MSKAQLLHLAGEGLNQREQTRIGFEYGRCVCGSRELPAEFENDFS
jgi:hypothetical protein